MKLPDGVSSLVYRDDDSREIVRKLQPEWIPVSERLPEETGMYLVTTVLDGFTGINIKEFTKYGEWYEYDMWQCERITAWMPLPEPYREDGEMNDE